MLPADIGYYLRSIGFLLIGQAIAMLFSFATTFVFTNYATKELYGSYSYILSIIGVMGMFSLPGVSNAITFSTAKGDEGVLIDGTRTRVKSSILGTLAIFIVSYFLWREGRKEIGVALAFSGLFFPLAYGTDSFLAYLQGKKRFGQLCGVSSFIAGLGSLGKVGVVLLYANLSLIFLVDFGIIAAANIFFLLWFVRQMSNKEVGTGFKSLSRNMSLLGILGSLSYFSNKLIIGTFSDMETMALFSFAFVMTEPMRTVGAFINKTALPVMIQKGEKELAVAIWKKMPLIVMVTFTAIAILELGFPYIIDYIFPKYKESIPYIKILVISSSIGAIGIILSAFLYSQESLRKMFYSVTLILSLLNIFINFVLCLRFRSMEQFLQVLL